MRTWRNSAHDEAFKALLQHEDPLVVMDAVEALNMTGKTEWKEIEPLLKHPSEYVRAEVLAFARNRLGIESKPLLIAALKDDNSVIKQAGLDNIGEMLETEELPLITDLLDDPDEWTRELARLAMYMYGWELWWD